jgi:hypothetical protein
LERWRAQLNVTTEQDGTTENDASPGGGEEEPEVAAEYEYLAEGGGQQRGDTQAMAPATDDQAAVADLPDPGAGIDEDETAAQVGNALCSLLCHHLYSRTREMTWLDRICMRQGSAGDTGRR